MQNTENRKAKFVSAVAYYDGERTIFGHGEVQGEILHDLKGNGGFGYDPLFYCTEISKSFGEATAQEKNAVSHRYRALVDLREKL